MPTGTLDRQRRSLAPLMVVTVAAMVFALLLILVRVQWAPLESADHGAAADINSLIAGDTTFVTVVKAVTFLGSGGVLWTVIGAAAILLALRKRWRLAIYLLVSGAGALILDPVLKSLVGRLRPVVAHPVAHGTGNSFPSGHALGSIVCYGAIVLVFLPAARGRWRTAFVTVIVALIALIGISRILLGVHYLSDVVGAWAIGITWLGVTAFAFELNRRAFGQPVTDPVTEGLEPEARADLALSRIYRGEHQPTDILGSLLFSALWLTATSLLINGCGLVRLGPRRGGSQPDYASRRPGDDY
jgi:undecaprenyl-diphosphatase